MLKVTIQFLRRKCSVSLMQKPFSEKLDFIDYFYDCKAQASSLLSIFDQISLLRAPF